MFSINPFAQVAAGLSAAFMQTYVVLMVLAVIAGTLFDVAHKGSAKFFERRKKESRARAERELGGGEKLMLAVETVAEAAVSGEFCKWPRRLSHLLMMYGFILYVISTACLVFSYPDNARPDSALPALWTLGACMVLVGGLWFFFFLRVNVAFDGDSPFHVGRADLFVGSLILSVLSALVWHAMSAAAANPAAIWITFGIYLFFTTVLFGTVVWSKFAHMFFKPAVAFQRRVEEADGSSDLPRPSTENYIVRS
ncbi:MAG: adenylyl-sulfate reductase [Betaproteobacteria bacterium]|nr:adenylyl-sulfate reductase [Betaproteobacteria bacterium]